MPEKGESCAEKTPSGEVGRRFGGGNGSGFVGVGPRSPSRFLARVGSTCARFRRTDSVPKLFSSNTASVIFVASTK